MSIKVNDKFGEWTVIGKVQGTDKWVCECSCGRTSTVFRGNLTKGLSKSCGKHSKYWQKKYHDYAKNIPEWRVWSNMKNRCNNPNNIHYQWYGGRGIKVCDRWQGEDGFKHFYSDMGERPTPEFTIERVDFNGNYEPDNCIWLHKSQQSKNRRGVKKTYSNDRILSR